MREQISITAYTFDELSDDAKEKARDWYRERALDYEWYDHVFDMAKEVGAALGITIKNIYFSGFASQGDGACFVGEYTYRADWRGKLREAFGEAIPAELERIGEALQLHRVFEVEDHTPDGDADAYETVSITKSSHYYSHENTVTITSRSDEVCDALRIFMRWIYSQLQQEYDWLNSDEQVDESIRANEYLFTESGSRCVPL